MIDPAAVRAHFPALSPESHADGKAPLFFDNPAGTQIASESLARMNDYLVRRNANHGGVFRTSRESDAMVRECRGALADFLGAAAPAEISFGQNMTSLTLHVSRSLARELSAGDEIVVTRLDHDANVSPWVLAARDAGATVRWLDFDQPDCAWSAEALARLVTKRTRIVAVGWASNSTGTINPVAAAARIAHEAGALCCVDAVHYAPHGPIDVAAAGCDILVCSAYKFFGPHTGILWGRHDLMQRLSAYKVRPAGDAPPEKWETGTQSFESIAGVLGALEYLEWLGRTFGGAGAAGAAGSGAAGAAGSGAAGATGERGPALRAAMGAIGAYEAQLSRAMLDGLSSIKGLKIRGITDPARLAERVPTYSFTLNGKHPRRICEELDKQGIYASDGNYYAVEVTASFGLDGKGGMVRVGATHYNTLAEVKRLVDAVRVIAR
jgi:cysteine desulfurase family protein (TIGR01976 family)